MRVAISPLLILLPLLVLLSSAGLSCSASTPAIPPPSSALATALTAQDDGAEITTIKQIVTAAYHRRMHPEPALRWLTPIVVDDYAIVDGSAGDAVVQALLRRQQGQWQVLEIGLGEPFSERAGLLAQKVPQPTIQKLLNIQAVQNLDNLVQNQKSCVTVIDDANPPTNVRSRPTTQANIVGKLNHRQELNVLHNRDGWLEINEPQGWVSLKLTRVFCGSHAQMANHWLMQLRQRGMQDDRAAIDLLLRYGYRGGVTSGNTKDAIAMLVELLAQKSMAIAVFDAQSEDVRRQVLQRVLKVGFSSSDRKMFAAKLAQQPNSPTAKTWADLQRSAR